jgi:hypothetical protein
VQGIEDRLHAASAGSFEAELVAVALEETDAEHGALFVWNKEANGLELVHHVVNGVVVTLPGRVVKKDVDPNQRRASPSTCSRRSSPTSRRTRRAIRSTRAT